MTNTMTVSFLLAKILGASMATAGGADLDITQARLDLARAANTFGYSATVRNDGPQEARRVEVLLLLPPQVGVRKDHRCSVAGDEPAGLVRCRLGTLAAGEERRVFVLIMSARQAPSITAIAVSDTPDPDPSNNVE
jgi:hypothetical protein